MKTETKKEGTLILVLGMHRSGTSTITRALKVLDVSLGDTLMPPIAGNNDKGFWEDLDLNALNIEMLLTIGSDWFHLTPIEAADVENLRIKGYVLRAAELLREKIKSGPVVALKDPRMAKLLPFWNEVTDCLQLNVGCVLTLRHPCSVVKSLAKRDGFLPEHSYLLWLGHVLESLHGSEGKSRVMVDYDRLMQSPDHEVSRIATVFRLKVNDVALDEYKRDFLDEGLRHTTHHVSDLLLDGACPPIVQEVYSRLLTVASGQSSLDDPVLKEDIEKWVETFHQLKTSLHLADKQYTQIASLSQAMTERDGQIASLNQAVAERDGQIASLSQALTERDGQITGLVHQLKLIQSSKSWALTRPLRYLQRLTQKGKIIAQAKLQGLPTIMKSIRQYGLIQTTTLAVHRVGLSRNRGCSQLTEPRKTFGPKTLRDSRPRKITVVSMLKNEKNIIETFAAHVLAMFDRVIFIDHRSTDGTQEYLQHLASVYPQVEVFVFDEEGYYQSEAMTWVVTKLIGTEHDGWVFFLDSDEFLPFSSRLEFEAELERYAAFPVISLPWLNLVPLQMEGVGTKRGKFLKPSKPAAHHKIAFQPSLIPFDEFAVAQGNHALLIGRHFRHPFPAEEAFSIYHLPVRTKSQLGDKIRHGVEAYKKMGSDRERGLGVHWDEINDLIGSNGITDEIMIDIIVRYGEPLSPPYGKSIKELRNQGYSEIELNVCAAQDLPTLVDFVRAEKINHSNLTEHHVQIGATSKRGMRIMLDAEKGTLRFHG